jgi:leucyl-tRNA synthetase
VTRFLERVWRLVTDARAREGGAGGEVWDLRPLHRFVKRLTDELTAYQFHTAIAGLMELTNWISATRNQLTPEQETQAVRTLVLLLAPFAPFLAEELWERLGRPYSVHQQPWPTFDPTQIEADQITLVVQVNGKVRDRLETSPDIAEADARAQALASPRVAPLLNGKAPRKVIYVPGRLVNIVV